MLRKLLFLASASLIGIGSANASTLFMPGASGVPDKKNEASLPNKQNGCLSDAATGTMYIAPYSQVVPPPTYNDCVMSFPVNLPAGSTIDGVEVAYYDEGGAVDKSIVAYLAVNRIKPYMGPLAVGGTSNSGFPTFQRLTMNMGALNVPVVNGDIFWVKVNAHRVTEVDYVAVTYH